MWIIVLPSFIQHISLYFCMLSVLVQTLPLYIKFTTMKYILLHAYNVILQVCYYVSPRLKSCFLHLGKMRCHYIGCQVFSPAFSFSFFFLILLRTGTHVFTKNSFSHKLGVTQLIYIKTDTSNLFQAISLCILAFLSV